MYNPDKYKPTRVVPSQLRGKERVRVILAASLGLFKIHGIEDVTTNDIAKHANIPIGSLYRYYPNKDAIIKVLTELYVEDLGVIFDDVRNHPLLPLLSWDEIVFMIVDAWVHYTRLNGSFAFLYAERANPRLRALNRSTTEMFNQNFFAVFTKRCDQLKLPELTVVLQLSIAASELGINEKYAHEIQPDMHRVAIAAISGYLDHVCSMHDHK